MTTNPNMAYPNTAKSDTFYPMFASGNLSYYQSFFNPNITTTTSTFPINSNFSYDTNAFTINHGETGNIYNITYDISESNIWISY